MIFFGYAIAGSCELMVNLRFVYSSREQRGREREKSRKRGSWGEREERGGVI